MLEVQEPVGITKEVGEWVVLECPVRSIPSGTVSWFRENESLAEQGPNERYVCVEMKDMLLNCGYYIIA